MINFTVCGSCTDWKGVEVGLSQNVILETEEAIRKAESLEQAASMLKITEAGLQYRLREYHHLAKLAQGRGWYTPRKRKDDNILGKPKPTGGTVEMKAGALIEKGDAVVSHEGMAYPFTEKTQAPEAKPSLNAAPSPANNISGKGQSDPQTEAQPEPKAETEPSNEPGKSDIPGSEPPSIKGQFDKNADLSKSPEGCKVDSVADVNQNEQTPPICQPKTAKPRKHHPDGFKRFEVCLPDELCTKLNELAKREMRPVNVQAGYMLKQVLEQA